ncbi:MAG: efflux RND transporter periplasmic adaptor subunit [Planctomycetota bacterium]
MRDKTILPLLLVILYPAFSIAPGCGEGPQAEAPPPPEVTIDSPVVQNVTRYHEYTGNTVAINQVDIVARVPGALVRQNYELLGDDNRVKRVEVDEVLFEIEHEPYEIAVASAKAEVSRSKALEAAARSVYESEKKSFERGASSELDLTTAEADFKQRTAERLASEAKLAQAELELSYTYVKSPIAGEVSRNLVDVGTYVGGGGPTVLTRVTQMQPIYVYFDVSEKIVLDYINRAAERGQQVADNPPSLELATSSDPKGTYSHKGIVDWWNRSVDTGTGTIDVRGRLDNREQLLVPGMFVRVRVPFEEIEDAVLVREDAIGTDLAGKYVLIVVKNEEGVSVVKRQPIELLIQADNGMRVVGGLSPDAQYITAGMQKVRPGMPVDAQQAAPPKPTEPAANPETQPEEEAEPASKADGEDA